MNAKDLEEIKKILCADQQKRIEKLEKMFFWFNTVAFGNLIAIIILFIKERFF